MIIIRDANVLFFIVEFLIGIFAISLALWLRRKDAAMLFCFGAVGNFLIEMFALLVGVRVYILDTSLKWFVMLAVSIGEGGAACCLVWLLATWIWGRSYISLFK